MKLHHKIIVAPICIMVFIVVLSFFIVQSHMRSDLTMRTEGELERLALSAVEAVEGLADPTDMVQVNDLADRLNRAVGVRFTFIDEQGKVLGDSSFNLAGVEQMENHAQRPEILEAYAGKPGISLRYSNSTKQNMVYVAVSKKMPSSGELYVCRASLPLVELTEALANLRRIFLWSGLLSVLAVGGLGWVAGHLLNRAVRREHIVLEQRVLDRTSEISIMQMMGGMLNACSTMEEAGEVINAIVPVLMPRISGAVSIIKSSRNRLDVLISWGEWSGRRMFMPSECWALRKGHQYFSKTGALRIPCPHMDGDSETQSVCIPLIAQGDTLGVFHVTADHDHVKEALQMASSVAEQIGLALANIRLRDNLRDQAIRDPLTGLYNRRYMTESLDQALARADRQDVGVAFFMMDLDHFKQFNDQFGHDAGDMVLCHVAQYIQDTVRGEDVACRYGGEELCLVCLDITTEDALALAQTLCSGVRGIEVCHNGVSLGAVTVSVGLAMYPDHGGSVDTLITAADHALYKAKAQGRDGVVIAASRTDEATPVAA